MRILIRLIFVLLALVAFAATAPARADAPARVVHLGEIAPIQASQGWGQLMIDKSVEGKPLQIVERRFERGLGTHSHSEIAYDLDGMFDRFEAWVGIDAEMKEHPEASAVFKVLVDGRECFDSGLMGVATEAKRVSVPLVGASELRLVVTEGGNNYDADHADWADAKLIQTSKPSAPKPKAKYEVRCPTLSLKLTNRGEIAEALLGKSRLPVRLSGLTRMLGCRRQGDTSCKKLPGGGLEFTRDMARVAPAQQCRIVQRFIPTRDSIRWELEIIGKGAPWSTPISLRIQWPDPRRAEFWAPWDDPEMSATQWHDPLVAKPFSARAMWIGSPSVGTNPQGGLVHFGGDCVSIPMATVLCPARDIGLSMILSPEDPYLDASLITSADGSITFTRMNHRISSERAAKFTADLVVHEADWRSGLGWMVNRYPHYFNPPNPHADEIAGCGAYSKWEGDLDVPKLKKMAFGVNWKASFDFPFCGMFIPPVKDDQERWTCINADSAGGYTGGNMTTSIAQLEAYSRKMRGWGFHVLSFFNVTEMGMGLSGVKVPDKKPGDPDLWLNPSVYVHSTFADAILRNEAGNTCGSWGNQIVLDPAAASFKNHLLAQAKLHIDKIPSSSGICIDRMDWIRPYNPNADDGVTWRNGKPMRALTESWNVLMAEMGPMMHRADKVIYVNALLKRLDLMRHIDGVYHEFGHLGANLNGTAFLCVRKPALAWTPPMASEKELAPDPDSYFQRHMHMGVFPTAPVPGNDHTINPSDWADRWYTDYGPLLNAMRGKKWVLEPRAVQVVNSDAKANLFEIPGGYAVPVTFGGKAESAVLRIRKPKGVSKWGEGLRVEALHPASEKWIAVAADVKGDVLTLNVPLGRGCAMVKVLPH